MANPLPGLDLSKVVLAVGALGTAAYGLVDTTKALGDGGVSKVGFNDIRKILTLFVEEAVDTDNANTSALGLRSIEATLTANWINGMALADQKAVAKALIKLNLSATTANTMATATGVSPQILKSIAEKLPTGTALTPEETDVYGRFDLLLSSLLDQGYQRGDQRYRNRAKILAVPFAVLLAVLGALGIYGADPRYLGLSVIAGLLATPLAPVAKDVASAIQVGAKVAQLWKK